MLLHPAPEYFTTLGYYFDFTAEFTLTESSLTKSRNWLRGLDLNQRPSGYEPDELPCCSTPRPIAGTILGMRSDASFFVFFFHFSLSGV